MINFSKHIKWHIRLVGGKILLWFGVMLIDWYTICGDRNKLHLHTTAKPNNTLFNTMSGEIFIGENTFFGHNVMVITGKHELKRIDGEWIDHVLTTGCDIHIGKRCWICSGSIILAGVTIGDDSIIAAGAIVTKDVFSGSKIKGVH